jgi:hypothetical protein
MLTTLTLLPPSCVIIALGFSRWSNTIGRLFLRSRLAGRGSVPFELEPSRPDLLSTLVFRVGNITTSGFSGDNERLALRCQQQNPTTMAASKTIAATTLATAMAMTLPVDIFCLVTPLSATLLAVAVGMTVIKDVITVPPMVVSCCVVYGVVIEGSDVAVGVVDYQMPISHLSQAQESQEGETCKSEDVPSSLV